MSKPTLTCAAAWRKNRVKERGCKMPRITLHLKGYLPMSQNALKGAHWSVQHREKRRAALALHRALQSDSSCEVEGRWTGITLEEAALNGYRTCWLRRLESFLATDGTLFREPLSARNATLPKKKASSS